MKIRRVSKLAAIGIAVGFWPVFFVLEMLLARILHMHFFGHVITCMDSAGSTENCDAAFRAARNEDIRDFVVLIALPSLASLLLGWNCYEGTINK